MQAVKEYQRDCRRSLWSWKTHVCALDREHKLLTELQPSTRANSVKRALIVAGGEAGRTKRRGAWPGVA